MISCLRLLKWQLSAIVILFSGSVLANTDANNICSSIKSTMDIIECARENHPDVQRSKLSFKKTQLKRLFHY